jgi:ABC-2 type transport system ATP-binding protein
MIEVRELTKDYGPKRVVNQLSFTAQPGMVTGIVGPSGSGKSTTIRIILGVDVPTSGTALVKGHRHATMERPMQTVGALLEPQGVPGECSAGDHLRLLARNNGIGRRRVADVLDQVELSDVAGQQIGELSLDMRQRLGIAGALLGDPGVLLFDEPMRGLDPEGMLCIRDLLQSLADEGRTVLLSSQDLKEMALTADELLIIRRGELVMQASASELIERCQRDVFVRSPRRSGLSRVLTNIGATVRVEGDGGLSVTGIDAWRIASTAAEHHIPIQELTPRSASLENFYQELTIPTAKQQLGHPAGNN